MTSPTLNEAAQYGADFVRGMKVVEANKVALHVSGAASIDEHGNTVHVGDSEVQADRMLVNIAAPICRPDLLCETEALAVLPRAVPKQ